MSLLVRLTLWFSLGFAHAAGASPVAMRDLAAKDVERLKKELPELFDQNPSLATLDEAVRRLMSGTSYENVFVNRKTDGSFELVGKPLRVVEDIKFTGVEKIDLGDLRSMLDFKVGDRFDRKKAVAAGERMKAFYGEGGYFNTVIEMGFEKAPNQNIVVTYNVSENPPCLIRGVEFTVANIDLRKKLNKRFSRLVGRSLTTERVRKLLRDLNEFLIDNRYLAAEIVGPDAKYNEEKTAAFLSFEIPEPYRWEFYFSGHKFFSQLDVYRALDLRNRERKNVDPANEGSERLRREYLAKGFPGIQIETNVLNPEGTYLKKVRYAINEGPRVKIKNIVIQGRVSRAPEYYEKFILQNSSNLVASGFYSRLDLENGFKNLVTELRNQGYLHARTLSSRVEYSEKKDFATVFLLVEEGPQTQVRALEFTGNKFFSNFELSEVSGLETNTPLKLNDFEASIEKLKQFYRNQGFLEMRLLNENESLIQYNEKGTQARIEFQIYEGPRIRVNSIAIEGNHFTKSYVILKEADFAIGEVLTPKKLEDGTARLNKLGLFSRAEIHTREEGTNIAERTLVISVTEIDPGTFTLGAGVNNEREFTTRGFTGFGYNNLWGTGRAFSSRLELKYNIAEVKYLEHEITAGYLEPFLIGSRTRGRVNVTQSERIFDYKPKNNNYTAITQSNRVDFSVERDLTTKTKFTFKTWSLESRKEWERSGRCMPDPNDTKTTDEQFEAQQLGKCPASVQQIATIGPALDVDYRDNPFLPTRGSYTRFTVNYSAPGLGSTTGIKFFHSDGGFTYYQRLGSPRLVWANSAHGGYVSNLSGHEGSGVPTSYAFFLGGIYTVRGFDLFSNNERIPRDGAGATDDDPNGFKVNRGNQLLIKTDSHYYLYRSELRFPIYNEHGGVLFYDGGEVKVSGYRFHRPYRDAVGFGYRYNTPVGPVALDLAFKLRPEPGEESVRFHLSIGTF